MLFKFTKLKVFLTAGIFLLLSGFTLYVAYGKTLIVCEILCTSQRTCPPCAISKPFTLDHFFISLTILVPLLFYSLYSLFQNQNDNH